MHIIPKLPPFTHTPITRRRSKQSNTVLQFTVLTLALSRALWGVPGPEAFEPLCWLTGATTVASGLSYLVGGGKCVRGYGMCVCSAMWRVVLAAAGRRRLTLLPTRASTGTAMLKRPKIWGKGKGKGAPSDQQPPPAPPSA